MDNIISESFTIYPHYLTISKLHNNYDKIYLKLTNNSNKDTTDFKFVSNQSATPLYSCDEVLKCLETKSFEIERNGLGDSEVFVLSEGMKISNSLIF